MKSFDATTRADNLERLAHETFDVIVIGGGITGAGVALDAAARGYTVALVEKRDFASGTSSKATKLVHGGIRYLPQFDIALVHEALVERGILIQNAPYLVEPLVFLLPLYEDARKPVGVPITPPRGYGLGLMLDMGLWMYDLLAGRRGVGRHKRISPQQAARLAPALRTEGLEEAFLYFDAQTNDTALTMAVIRTAAQHGAVIANCAEVVGFTQAEGKLTGAVVRDALTGASVTVSARHIVNAAGIFAQRVQELTGHESHVTMEPSKGVHLVVERERVRLGDTAVVIPETDDNRILFVVPWEGRALIGTTDTGTGDLDDPEANPTDIEYLLAHVNRYLDANLTRDDILSTYAGYRPLVRSRKKPTANLSRTHVVIQEDNGMVTIVGGKLTTYRRMAQDTMDVIAKRDGLPRAHPTERLLLDGSLGWKRAKSEIEQRAQRLGLTQDVLHHLELNYGRNAQILLDLAEHDAALRERLVADLPYIRAEVVYACRYEMALTLDDVMARRTRLALEDRERGVGVAPSVAELMAGELGWSQERIRAEVDDYIAQVGHQLQMEQHATGETTPQYVPYAS
jgi:glycerol-3-phosphate dehydrogenase